MLQTLATLVVDQRCETEAALQHAAAEHGVDLRRHPVKRATLVAAINEYRGLFRPAQTDRLTDLRRLAARVMCSLQDFAPRVIGDLVHGGGPLLRIRLLLRGDEDQLAIELLNRHIPYRASATQLRHGGGRHLSHPTLCCEADSIPVELLVMKPALVSDPPLDPFDHDRLPSLDLQGLEALLADHGPG